jgi:DNA topoisomerase-1
MPRDKVVAVVVCLLESTLLRVGNEHYARTNGSYGLTTLRDRHVDISRDAIRIACKGKHGIRQRAVVSDARLAGIVRRCRELPGQELFQYVDERGEPRVLSSGEVNDYLREASGGDFTAKDFRTWFGTLAAMQCLESCVHESREKAGRQAVLRAIERAADRLGNTPAMCRKCYVHPAVIHAFLSGRMIRPRVRNPERRLLVLLESAAADPTGIEAWASTLRLRARTDTKRQTDKRNTKPGNDERHSKARRRKETPTKAPCKPNAAASPTV